MPDNLNQRLHDAFVKRDLRLLRLAAGDGRRMLAQLQALGDELFRRLRRVNPSADQQKRVDDLLKTSTPTIRDFFRDMYRGERDQLIDVMDDETEYFKESVQSGLDTSRATIDTLLGTSVPRAMMRDIIENRVITANANDAERLRGFFEREAASYATRYGGSLRQSFSQDETITQLVDRLEQVTAQSGDAISRTIRTGYNHAVNHLRVEMMQRNSILFRGVIAISILDTRTTDVCKSRSRAMWDLNTGKPLPESPLQIPYPGPPPWHFACRTQLSTLTKSAEEIGEEGSEDVREAINSLSAEQKRLLSPDPPDNENYNQWLKRQPIADQVEALGRGRYELWRDGRARLQDLVTQDGRPLTIRQIMKRTAA